MVAASSSTKVTAPAERDAMPCLRVRLRAGRAPRYVIHHGALQISTKTSDKAEAMKQFGVYIDGLSKTKSVGPGLRTRVGDLLANHSLTFGKTRTEERQVVYSRIYKQLLHFFGDKEIAEVDKPLCVTYAAARQTPMRNGKSIGTGSIRTELAFLKGVISDFCVDQRIDWTSTIFMPPKPVPRAIFATRSELASLLKMVRRGRTEVKRLVEEVQPDQSVIRKKVLEPEDADAVARFLLIALYTGTRMSAILEAGWNRHPQRGHFDLKEELFYRKGSDERTSNKRRPPVRLCSRILALLRRWKAADVERGHDFVVHDASGEVLSVNILRWRMERALRSTGIAKNLTPHAMRHTTATWMLEGGASLASVGNALGATARQVEKTYGEWDVEFSVAASNALASWGR